MSSLYSADLASTCRRYLVKTENDHLINPHQMKFDLKLAEAKIFQDFLLFDEVVYPVVGENIPLAFLVGLIGLKGVERLLESDSLSFILMDHDISYIVSDVPGVEPLALMKYSNAAYTNPEISLELGLNWAIDLSARQRRMLINKVRDKFKETGVGAAQRGIDAAKSAFTSGRLKLHGVRSAELVSMPLEERRVMGTCATEFMNYGVMLTEGLTSNSNHDFFELFIGSARRIVYGAEVSGKYEVISRQERVPDLISLYSELTDPFLKMLKLRDKGSSKKFRKWLYSGTGAADEVLHEYIAAIDERRGYFETREGRFSKLIAVAGITTSVGSFAAGPLGTLAGAAAAPFVEGGVDVGLDLLDEFVLSGLLKGWSPRIYFDDLRKLVSTN